MGMKACMQYGVYGDILELAERFVLDTVHEQWQLVYLAYIVFMLERLEPEFFIF